MKKTYKRVPFNIELVKKIQSREVEGRIVTSENLLVRIVDFNLKDKTDSIVYIGTYANGEQEFIQTCDNEGKSFGVDVLFIELPEETPKHEFKVGDVVTFLEGELKDCHGVIREINSNGSIDVATYSCDVLTSVKRISKVYSHEEKHEFKPFDKVLVRDNDASLWRSGFYSHELDGRHCVCGNYWPQCIPYEGNENLVGTTNKPKDD